jgi:bifunctional non-homologous end joining protein LigD
MSLPRIELMQPTLLARPFHREGWIFEEKIDGWRMLAFKEGDHVRLVSRQGRDHTKRFSDLANAIRALAPETLILDGEVAVFDERLISRFEWMQHGKKQPGVATPPMFMAFDCLYIDDVDLRPRELRARREALMQAIEYAKLLLAARRLADDGLKAWRQVEERGYEGFVAKDECSPYSGGRTLSWLKVKQAEFRVEERGWSPQQQLALSGPRCW